MNATQLMIAANQAKLDGFTRLAQAFEALLRKELQKGGGK